MTIPLGGATASRLAQPADLPPAPLVSLHTIVADLPFDGLRRTGSSL